MDIKELHESMIGMSLDYTNVIVDAHNMRMIRFTKGDYHCDLIRYVYPIEKPKDENEQDPVIYCTCAWRGLKILGGENLGKSYYFAKRRFVELMAMKGERYCPGEGNVR